jgi:hypothetical protein
VQRRIFFGEGPAVELDIVAVEEAVGDVRGLVGFAGVLGVAGDVDASKDYLSPMAVSKLAVFDLETERRHDFSLLHQISGCRDGRPGLIEFADLQGSLILTVRTQ